GELSRSFFQSLEEFRIRLCAWFYVIDGDGVIVAGRQVRELVFSVLIWPAAVLKPRGGSPTFAIARERDDSVIRHGFAARVGDRAGEAVQLRRQLDLDAVDIFIGAEVDAGVGDVDAVEAHGSDSRSRGRTHRCEQSYGRLQRRRADFKGTVLMDLG